MKTKADNTSPILVRDCVGDWETAAPPYWFTSEQVEKVTEKVE